MATHKLKTWPGFFEDLIDGKKKCEIRRDDRGFQVGDTLVLQEYRPHSQQYTGREYRALVSHIIRNTPAEHGLGQILAPGYVCMSLSVRM